MLAEKIETREEFCCGQEYRVRYFQGYFLRRPEVMVTHEIPLTA